MDDQTLLGLVFLGLYLLAFSIEICSGRLRHSPRPGRDLLFTVAGVLSHVVITGALIGSLAGLAVAAVWGGESAGSLAYVPFWLAFVVIFLGEEMLHYWIHRFAHEWRWLWKIHRTHHSAQQLNVGVIYRYNVFWVALLPQAWVGAFAVYLGQADAFAAAISVAFVTNLLTHTNMRWDLWLRRKAPWSEPLWWVIERVITLPDTHHAHHAYGKGAHPNGNYAVTLFIYDIMFGTAYIPNRRQTQYGLPIAERLHWAEELFWPLVKKPLLPKPVSPNPVALIPRPGVE